MNSSDVLIDEIWEPEFTPHADCAGISASVPFPHFSCILTCKYCQYSDDLEIEIEMFLTKKVFYRIGRPLFGTALLNLTGEPLVFVSVCCGNSEACSQSVHSFGQIHILRFKDPYSIGLEGDRELTRGQISCSTLQYCTVSLQYVCQIPPDHHCRSFLHRFWGT